ncbi:DUF3833 family protein [Alkalimonas delamerensis]|uniref:DUF3833 family protein n=1 Tax=Alkalimonas delamerensis TaxID=265981 RepID=A0ABT9GM42_9GAMM|nr:DUF3833 family protein [Alkalimonas delamerensis]MDP4527756.1 DUF3833 family protein [Alkalimonas delamerensis]
MRLAAPLFIALLLLGCSRSVLDYQAEQPELRLDQFFTGTGRAYGVLQDWRGRQSLRFHADLCGVWQQNQGDLYEVFYFSDGRVDYRHWQLQLHADGRVTGQAHDVLGEASGQLAGNALYWEYRLAIPYRGDSLAVSVKDWMYLVTPEQIINRTSLHKFGLKVADLTMSLQQVDTSADCTPLRLQLEQLAADAEPA